ncbi:hypothetical protein WJ0W_004070 [Paenibacillus melissococcoides]|uniref:Uncharacterized protein n=1 Tax=Paenibacillus melissococcoides TaxID=2912268 RepID=A0ABN8U6V7_9BACL|nr:MULTISPECIES: hypothetical protein [Paenibacillus]GIO81940.1 hypothetical protein J6TS7_55500 [Paenibacillus dendritiformis]CAH8246838.1 hypothetical protein WJ0W_004070 [Paenibacillus melissococcoides]CAH8715908.1 hypothetical protein HTL2_004440 [Paenibacillus melissococcoides]CAH8716863.1 hypothetical protein WDD9_004707 [Paenibacillus melissococcoides]
MTKKIFALTLASVMLLSSQVAMAAPSAASNALNKAQQHSAMASSDIEVNVYLKVGEGRQLAGTGFWVGYNSTIIDLSSTGYLIALKPGSSTVVAYDPNGNRILYYVTITR